MVDTTTTNYALVKPEIGASNNTWGTKINANLDALDSMVNTIRATYGGTANAITLTATGAALSTGLRVSFTPTDANTGATTINLNALGAIAVQPLARSGVALPSGYIRANVPVTAVYNGTVWLIERQTEYGTNANGDFTRFADGRAVARVYNIDTGGTIATAAGNVFRSTPGTWTYPMTFSGDAPTVNAWPGASAANLWCGGGSSSAGLSSAQFQVFSPVTSAADSRASLTAIGVWF